MTTVTKPGSNYEIVPVPGRRHQVRKWVAWAAWAVAVLAPLVFVVAALGAKFGLWSWQFGLGVLSRSVGTNLLFLAVGVGVVSVLLALLIKPRLRRGLVPGVVALFVGLAGLGYGAGVRAKAQSLPFIHDISTDTQDPPVFAGRILAERERVEGVNTLDYTGKTAPNGKLVSVAQARGYPDVRPIISDSSPEVALARARDVAESLGWEIKDTSERAIEATATTFWYGFEDDVVVRVRPGAGGGSVVDVRSVSRVGGSDLGANADRIRAFIEAF